MITIDLGMLKGALLFNLESLSNFEFTCINPLFWIIIFILFYVLERFWETKNAFTFSFLTSAILLLTTEFEGRIAEAFSRAAEPFDPGIIRLIAVLIIAILFLAYAFLR